MQAILHIEKAACKQYYIKDVPKTSLLNVRLSYKETPGPGVTAEACMRELKEAGVDLTLVNMEAVTELIERNDGGSGIVAEGIYPVDGKDCTVKYLFKESKYRNPDFDTDKKVDLLDHTIIPTVNVGEVLAYKSTLPTPGQDGRTVTGEIVKAKPGKDINFKAGEGTILMDKDTKIVAAINGRPILKNGMVTVVPILVIPRNVDASTGNIYFDGAVLIKGSVMDNMKVIAKGSITVYGNVLNATLSAGGNIDIAGNTISSKIYVGGGVANKLCILPKMQQIYTLIKRGLNAATSKGQRKAYGHTYQRISDAPDAGINKLEVPINDIKGFLDVLPEDEAVLVKDILRDLNRVYGEGRAGVAESQIGRLTEGLNKKIQQYLQTYDDVSYEHANLKLKYAQNSSLHVCGDVIITGRGIYQTDIIAKKSIAFVRATSVVLGGTLIAEERIDMGIVGTPSGIKTYCKVLKEKGKINAVRFLGNTVLNIHDKVEILD